MTVNVISVGDLELRDYLKRLPEITELAMQMAINTVASRTGMSLVKKNMLNEVAFPSGYLNPDRLKVTKRATRTNLEATITGRKRATSLARFVTSNSVVNSRRKEGVSVRVKRGKTTYLKNAFLVRLKKGASLSEDNYNIGLAVRLSAGESLSNKRTQHKSWLVPGKVALLYGPSVDQVFSEVAEKVGPQIADLVATEFFRNFGRLS